MIGRCVVLILLPLLAGCGYYSTKSKTAKDIKSIAVTFFQNNTAEPNLEIAFTELVINNLLRDNTLKVVAEDDADALLEGSIVAFRNVPFSFNADLNAEEYIVRSIGLVTSIEDIESIVVKTEDGTPIFLGQVADVYRRFYPLFQDAYVDLGYPNGYFNDRLIEVIDDLLATPDKNEPVSLVRPHVLYEFSDPDLESLSSGQKMLLRMGSEHRSSVKQKLREFRNIATQM